MVFSYARGMRDSSLIVAYVSWLFAVPVAPLYAGPAEKIGEGAPVGDVNLDGGVDLNDIEAFWLASHRVDVWQQRYGGTPAALLQVADFDHNGSVDNDDIDGFANVVAAAVEARMAVAGHRRADVPRAGSGPVVLLSVATRGVDIDVDSNNDDGGGLPERSDAEDAAEAASGAPGKIINYEELVANPIRVPAVLTIETDSTNLNCDYGRVFTWYVNYDTTRATLHTAQTGTTTYGDYNPGTQSPTFSRRYWYAGDLNGNKAVSTGDIGAWLLALNDPAGFATTYPCVPLLEAGDFNGDGVVSISDNGFFIAAITAGSHKPAPIHMWVEAEPQRSTTSGDISLDVSASVGNTWYGTGCAPTGCNCTTPPCASFYDAVKLTVDSVGGGARPWGASVSVNPFSSVDLRTGKVLTKLGLAGHDPHGPPLAFNLYHNSRPSVVAAPRIVFDLPNIGQNWTTSYSTYIRGSNGDPVVTVVRDTGDVDFYTDHASGSPTRDYDPPRGVYNDLRWDENYGEDGGWVLTTPSQQTIFYVESDTAGVYRVDALDDSSGNRSSLDLTTQYDNVVRGSADYNPGGLHGVYSRIHVQSLGSGADILHSDEFTKSSYIWDSTNLVLTSKYQGGFDVKVQMDAAGRITELTERSPTGVKWTYEYYDISPGDNSGRLWKVKDPSNSFEQVFEYDGLSNGYYVTRYKDRRGFQWTYEFDAAGNLVKLIEPLGSPAYTRKQTFDVNHNRLTSTDERNQSWTYTYGAVGNVLTVASPLTGASAQTWTYTWQQPDANRWNFYRLVQMTDPLSHWVALEYDSSEDDTLVTCIREMPAVAGGAEGVTRLDYYLNSEDVYGVANARMGSGQLKSVTDANGCQTAFRYDKRGLPAGVDGGIPTEPAVCQTGGSLFSGAPSDGPWTDVTSGSSGVPMGGSDAAGGTQGNSYDGQGQLNATKCLDVTSGLTAPLERFGIMPPSQPEVAPLTHASYPDHVDWRMTHNDTFIDRQPSGSNESYDLIGIDIAIAYNASTLDPLQRVGGVTQSYEFITPSPVTRSFEFEHNGTSEPLEVAPTQVNPPAGDSIVYKRSTGARGFDLLGRPEMVERGTMRVTYTYDAAGRVTVEQYHTLGSSTVDAGRMVRTYDNANRLLTVAMYDGASNLMTQIAYTWNKDNAVLYRDELQSLGQSPPWVRTTFGYDARKRLTYEKRVEDSVTIYELEFHYDQLGNRMSKVDLLNQVQTDYYYDVDLAGTLQADDDDRLAVGNLPTALDYVHENGSTPVNSSDNRLLYYIERPVSGDAEDVTREVWYTYYQMGNPAHIVLKDAGDAKYRSLAMSYATDESLWRVLWDEWDGGRFTFNNYRIQGGQTGEPKPREFYYNGIGGRFLTRPMTITGNTQSGYVWTPIMTGSGGKDQYSDTLGLLPTGDFLTTLVTSPTQHFTISESDQYLQDGSLKGRKQVGIGEEFWFSDLVGSIVRTTDGFGEQQRIMTYTAFGEQVQPSGAVGGTLPLGASRYGYVGAHGYESDRLILNSTASGATPILLSHVGLRWYDAKIGRFIQRDPAGTDYDINPYVYVYNNPLSDSDRTGLSGTSVDRSILEAIRTGNVRMLKELLESAGQSVTKEVREKALEFIKKMESQARKWIEETRKGSIWREFPDGPNGQWAGKTLEEIKRVADAGDAIAKKCWKLLNDSRFLKTAQ